MKDERYKSVTMKTETVKKLESLKRPGQSLDGVVQELIQERVNMATFLDSPKRNTIPAGSTED